MLMDKKGKLFGKISIIDILIVLAVIVCAIGVYTRFVDQPEKVRSQTQTFTYKVYVNEIREMSIEGLKKSVGTTFLLNEKGRSDVIGKLVSVEPAHYSEPIVKSDGSVVMAEMPSKYEAVLTMEIDGIVSDSGYYTTDYKSIGVGSDLLMMNKYISITGQIIEIIEK